MLTIGRSSDDSVTRGIVLLDEQHRQYLDDTAEHQLPVVTRSCPAEAGICVSGVRTGDSVLPEVAIPCTTPMIAQNWKILTISACLLNGCGHPPEAKLAYLPVLGRPLTNPLTPYQAYLQAAQVRRRTGDILWLTGIAYAILQMLICTPCVAQACMNFYPAELVTPPLALVALLGCPKLHAEVGEFLRRCVWILYCMPARAHLPAPHSHCNACTLTLNPKP